jgi:hypothetical protein
VARLYLDNDPPLEIAQLVDSSHDIVTTRQLGRERAHDEEQLLYGAQTGRAVITHNWNDFRMLHAAWMLWSLPLPHAGILVLAQRGDAGLYAGQIDWLLARNPPLENRLYHWSPANGWRPWDRSTDFGQTI